MQLRSAAHTRDTTSRISFTATIDKNDETISVKLGERVVAVETISMAKLKEMVKMKASIKHSGKDYHE